MATPVLMADPHKDIAPHTYVVQVDSFECLNCKAIGKCCEVFAKTFFKGQWERKYVHNFRPMRDEKPQYNLPIEVIYKPLRVVAFCHECPDPGETLKGLPYPPVEVLKVVAGSSFTENTDTKKESRKKPAVTTDDLMKGLDI